MVSWRQAPTRFGMRPPFQLMAVLILAAIPLAFTISHFRGPARQGPDLDTSTYLKKPPGPEPKEITGLKESLRLNFGLPGYRTSWYGAIKDIWIDGQKLVVLVDPVSAYGAVCRTMTLSAMNNQGEFNVSSLVLVDHDGRVIFTRPRRSGICP
jgi:hypothetical protein